MTQPAQPSSARWWKASKMLELHRAAQWRLDFVAAENSMGFHAPQETARILGESIDLSRRAQILAIEFQAAATTRPAAPSH